MGALPQPVEAARPTYSAALQSPTKSSATKYAAVETSPTKPSPAQAGTAGAFHTQNTNTQTVPEITKLSKSPVLSTDPKPSKPHKEEHSKASYSTIAGNSPVLQESAQLNHRPFLALKPRCTMGGIVPFPSSVPRPAEGDQQGHAPEGPEKATLSSLPEQCPPFEWPPKTPQRSKYDLDSAYAFKGAATYTVEKALPMCGGFPVKMSNGLLDALDGHLQKREGAKNDKETGKDRKPSKSLPSGLREAVQAAARDSAAKYGSGRSPAKDAQPRVDDIHTSDPIKESSTAKATTTSVSSSTSTTSERGWISKPAIPFDHSYASNLDWLIECEELPRDEKGRSYLPSRDITAEQYHGNGSAADTDLPETATVVEEASPRKTAADRKTVDDSPFHWSLRGLEVRLRNKGYEGDLTNYFGNTSKRAQQAAVTGAPLGPEAWAVDVKAEKTRWYGIQANMLRSRLGEESPFVPQTFEDYLRHRRIVGINEQMDALKRLREAVERQQSVLEGLTQLELQEAQLEQKLVEASTLDGLSVVLGRPSIWTQQCLEQAEVDWPSPVECASMAGYALPPPRIRSLDDGVPYDERMIAEFAQTPAFDMLCHHEARELSGQEELGQDQESTQLFLNQIKPTMASFIKSTQTCNGDA